MEDEIDFGKYLKDIRKELGCSQEYIGEVLGVTRQQVGLLEHNKRKLKAVDYIKIKRLLSERSKTLETYLNILEI